MPHPAGIIPECSRVMIGRSDDSSVSGRPSGQLLLSVVASAAQADEQNRVEAPGFINVWTL